MSVSAVLEGVQFTETAPPAVHSPAVREADHCAHLGHMTQVSAAGRPAHGIGTFVTNKDKTYDIPHNRAADVATWVRESRTAQGLSERVTDEGVLNQVRALVTVKARAEKQAA